MLEVHIQTTSLHMAAMVKYSQCTYNFDVYRVLKCLDTHKDRTNPQEDMTVRIHVLQSMSL